MFSKTFAAQASAVSLPGGNFQKRFRAHLGTQSGVTLIELMVGIAIGLLVIAVAMGALMVSRGVSGTVSDASNIQQQAAYAMRVMGQQLRQSGSVRLDLNPGTVITAEAYMAPVAFEIKSGDLDLSKPDWKVIEGKDTPGASEYKLTPRFSNYIEPLFTSAAAQTTARDCLGANPSTTLIESNFRLENNELRCASFGGAAAQPIVQNVANFQVNYLVQDNTTTLGIPTIKSVNAAGVTNWAQVQAVEVCLVLYGAEPIDLPAGSNYTDCDGATAVDMSTLTGLRTRRMHMVFRNVFQLRSQGLIGTVL